MSKDRPHHATGSTPAQGRAGEARAASGRSTASPARVLLERALRHPRQLVRALIIGEVIGERRSR